MRPFFQNGAFSLTLVRDFYALIDKHRRGGTTVETLLGHRTDAGACARPATYDERFSPLDTPASPHPPHEGLGRAKVGLRPVWPEISLRRTRVEEGQVMSETQCL